MKTMKKKYIFKKYNLEEILYSKIALIVDSFIDIYKLDNKNFLKKVFDAAFQLIPEAEKGSLFELNGDKYVPIFTNGYDFELLQKLEFSKDEFFIGFECYDVASIDTYEVYISKRDDSKFSKETLDIFKKLGTYSDFSSLYAPIQVEGINIGLICLENFSRVGYSKVSKKILKFYAQMISNMYSQIIYREKETSLYHEIVTALVSAIEVKDEYTEGHAKRVREYSCAIAESLKLSNQQINDIDTAALLHDIGKIGIPTEILNKPGKLSTEEYEIIKLHPVYAKKILDNISSFSTIVNITYNHHEHYDGTGYPQGLKGEKIPFEAQIVQLADAYDAMTSERSYRKALSVNEAIEVIRKETGKQFHPEIAKAALKLFSNKF
jgi:HD superfamily phosphodiesterase